MNTFKSVFGDGGNLNEIEFDWQCENCGKDLNFKLGVCSDLNVEWEARCCESRYTITPYVAAYNQEPV